MTIVQDRSTQLRTLRWGIVGTGRISDSVVADLAACQGTEIRTVHSRDAGKAADFAKKFADAGSTDSYEELLADPELDVVYIATPFATHYALTRDALLAGKHVLVEKPMAVTAGEVEKLFQIARERNLFLMEGMWMKFNPAFILLQEQIARDRIGAPRSLRAMFGMPFPQDGGSRWDVKRSGSTLLDQGIYPVTLAHTIFGVPESVYAAGTVRSDGLDLAEHFTLEYTDGRFAQCASSSQEFADLSGSISGTKGWIVLPGPFWSTTSIQIHAGSWQTIIHAPESVDLDREGNGYVPMLRAVNEAITAGLTEHPLHTAADTTAVFRTLDMIRSAILGGNSTVPKNRV
ncbi:Gfo/Idh/MocA family oxidoreductase [Arthrobacter sp. NQ7]|uniref:Gfo/Idh/MocA family protein n=1 Tax=Arthrobacter sp. NQ7 TaxID=3032303 RepID=UPI00240EA11D|nr:Gfo/Idh/MocA family oxidoreductase [Arthrobacter sp. NQ7]MDJ0458647.1 Gfo/Idh/MocA family oxidoreductase [Arthrobacter sp. NQ7]